MHIRSFESKWACIVLMQFDTFRSWQIFSNKTQKLENYSSHHLCSHSWQVLPIIYLNSLSFQPLCARSFTTILVQEVPFLLPALFLRYYDFHLFVSSASRIRFQHVKHILVYLSATEGIMVAFHCSLEVDSAPYSFWGPGVSASACFLVSSQSYTSSSSLPFHPSSLSLCHLFFGVRVSLWLLPLLLPFLISLPSMNTLLFSPLPSHFPRFMSWLCFVIHFI